LSGNGLPKIAHVNDMAFNGTIISNSPLSEFFDFSVHRKKGRYEWFFAGLGGNVYRTGLELADYVDRKLRPDVIHVHSAPEVPAFFKSVNPDYKIIYTSAGSDIRDKGWKYALEQGVMYADIITVLNEDVLSLPHCPERAIFTPYAADPVHFERTQDPVEGLGLMRTFRHGKLSNELAQKKYEEVKQPGYKLWKSVGLIPYSTFPNFLEMFEIYYDFKFVNGTAFADGHELPISRTALEVLTLGKTKVYFQDQILTEIPIQHTWEFFINGWKGLYNLLLEC
jgi:hypothetical protein